MVSYYVRSVSIATANAFMGLVRGARNDHSFRVECILACILIPLAIYLPVDKVWTTLMCASTLMVLAAELFNASIEQTVNYISKEYNVIARRIKDMSSAGVLIVLIVFSLV